MKYVVLAYGTQQEFDALGKASPEELAPLAEFLESFTGELRASGELVDTEGLAAPVHTRRIRRDDAGAPLVTDGPYAETAEVLAGYWVVDCASFDRATEIAARLVECPMPFGVFADTVAEVRPLDPEYAG